MNRTLRADIKGGIEARFAAFNVVNHMNSLFAFITLFACYYTCSLCVMLLIIPACNGWQAAHPGSDLSCALKSSSKDDWLWKILLDREGGKSASSVERGRRQE